MRKRLRIGVCGLGRIGSLHAKNVSSSPWDVELVSVADPIKPLARSIAARFGARAYFDPSLMISSEELDGVIICTPTPMHVSHVELAAEQNLSIFLEKPISLTLRDADRIVSIVNRRHVKCMLGFNRRSDVSYGKAKLDIIKGKIGKPILVKTCARDPQPPPDEYIKHSGGIFVDECIHDFDVALWLMNKRVRRVSAIGKTLMYPQFAKYGDYDNAVAILEFRDGELGIIEGSRTSKYGYDLLTEVLGAKGSVNIDNWRDDSTRVFTSKGSISEPGSWFLERFADSYRNELDRFYSYIRKDSDSPVSVEDGREALRVALASTEAAKKGHSVTLTD